jgi:hypothetical protein
MKKIILTLVVLVVAIGCYAFYLKSKPAVSVTPTLSQTSTVSSAPIHVAIRSIYADEKNFPATTNTSTAVTVSFRTDSSNQTVNVKADLFVNQKRVDQLVGESISMRSFSPSNNYFAFRSQAKLGAATAKFTLHVVDLVNLVDIGIEPPRSNPTGLPAGGQDVIPFIGKYAWSGDHAVDITFYFVSFDQQGTYYRISPAEIWHYDLSTGSYTLATTLPE